MLSTLNILFPVFALIATGYMSRKFGILGANAAKELTRFVIWLALPALLFGIMARSDWQTLFQVDFILTFTLGSFAVFFLVLAWRMKQGVDMAMASIESIAASYANTAYIGFPLLFLVFGEVSGIPTAIASVIVVSLLFGMALVLIESSLHASLAWHLRIFKVIKSVFKNPLMLAPIAGALFAATPFSLPSAIDSFLNILSSAAIPCALISLGLFLASTPTQEEQCLPCAQKTALGLTFAKLILQPIFVAILAFYVFHLPTELALIAVFLAALPTGTGPYMLAEFYQRDALIIAQTILFSTIFSLISLSVLLQYVP